jgi:uncharacterized protein
VDDLRERLRRLERAYGIRRIRADGVDPPEGDAGSRALSVRDQLERIDSRRLQPRYPGDRFQERAGHGRLEEVLPGREVETPLGGCYEAKSVYRNSYRHGEHRINALLEADMEALSLFCGGVEKADIRPEDFLFLDVETTGLSLGTGTYVFLIGLGYFSSGQYHIHQVFLRDFGEEPAFLYHTRQLMRPFRYLVTFNGKRFDIPLLEARFTMCSQPDGLRDMASWDLLYPARRLWFDRLEDCRLGTIERERLGVAREGLDIDGDQIPRVYFRYVHDGDARDIDRIAYHNAMDVLTMTALAIHIDRSLKERDPVRSNLFSVGKYYEKKGIREIGEAYYELASSGGASPQEKDRALFHLGRQRKREGRIEEAIRMWKDLIEREGHGFGVCCVELAKYLEHQTREYDEGIRIVSWALERLGPEALRLRRDLEKRLDRLRRKRGKACKENQ